MSYTAPPISQQVVLTVGGYTPPSLSTTIILGVESADYTISLSTSTSTASGSNADILHHKIALLPNHSVSGTWSSNQYKRSVLEAVTQNVGVNLAAVQTVNRCVEATNYQHNISALIYVAAGRYVASNADQLLVTGSSANCLKARLCSLITAALNTKVTSEVKKTSVLAPTTGVLVCTPQASDLIKQYVVLTLRGEYQSSANLSAGHNRYLELATAVIEHVPSQNTISKQFYQKLNTAFYGLSLTSDVVVNRHLSAQHSVISNSFYELLTSLGKVIKLSPIQADIAGGLSAQKHSVLVTPITSLNVNAGLTAATSHRYAQAISESLNTILSSEAIKNSHIQLSASLGTSLSANSLINRIVSAAPYSVQILSYDKPHGRVYTALAVSDAVNVLCYNDDILISRYAPLSTILGAATYPIADIVYRQYIADIPTGDILIFDSFPQLIIFDRTSESLSFIK